MVYMVLIFTMIIFVYRFLLQDNERNIIIHIYIYVYIYYIILYLHNFKLHEFTALNMECRLL